MLGCVLYPSIISSFYFLCLFGRKMCFSPSGGILLFGALTSKEIHLKCFFLNFWSRLKVQLLTFYITLYHVDGLRKDAFFLSRYAVRLLYNDNWFLPSISGRLSTVLL